MKYISKIALTLILIISFSCTEDDSTLTNNENNLNKTATVSDNIKIVQANLVDTNPNLYTVEVKITNKKTEETLPIFVHKFIPDNTSEIMKDLPKKISTFNGVFLIEVEGQVLHRSIIKNGVVTKSEINKFSVSAFAKRYPCTIDGITSCADDQINDMNWIEYSFCLAGAPACLAQLYLSCSWENC